MPDREWNELLDSALEKSQDNPTSRFLQLATINSLGHPECRTVVFRGFSEDYNLEFITDNRSAKWQEIKSKPDVSVCWYFTETREQFRFAGIAQENVSDANRINHWQRLSESAKQQFHWGQPGSIKDPKQQLELANGTALVSPPEHFVVVDIQVETVDYLSLYGEPQTRLRFTKQENSSWQIEHLIP